MWGLPLLVVAIAACGRIGFDASSTDGGDDAPDGHIGVGTCDDPIDLEVASVLQNGFVHYRGSTTGATDHGTGVCGCTPESPDLVFRYTPTATGRLEAMLQATTNTWDTTLHVRTTCTDAGTQFACNEDTNLFDDPTYPRGYGGSWFETDVVGGVPIYLFADGCLSSGEFDLDLRVAAQPYIGTCTNPIELAAMGTVQGDGSITYDGDTRLGFDHGEPMNCTCESQSPDLVIRWVPTTSGAALITLAGEDELDVLLHARSTCASQASEIDCNDDSGGSGDSSIQINVTAGAPVFLFADGCRILQRGRFQLRVEPP